MAMQGLDRLQRHMKELADASQALNGTITTVNFNPDDPESVADAMRQVEAAIDRKIAPYHSNPTVMKMADELKEKYRQGILNKKNETQA